MDCRCQTPVSVSRSRGTHARARRPQQCGSQRAHQKGTLIECVRPLPAGDKQTWRGHTAEYLTAGRNTALDLLEGGRPDAPGHIWYG